MVGPAYVFLSQHKGEDPRTTGQKEPKTVSFRVTLQRHHDPVCVVVEIEDGQDGAGAPHWRRIDNGGSRRARRAAYETLERIAAEYYERATAAEERAVRAEKAEAAARTQRAVPVMPRLAMPDARTKARETLDKLLELANHAGTPTDEARNAALAAVRLMQEHKMAPR